MNSSYSVSMFNYPDYRFYGPPPYEVVLIHGGPGGPGEMEPVAQELSSQKGILEPLQKGFSLDAQVQELYDVLITQAQAPVVLIGWSWGAMLGLIFTAKHPTLVKKLILVNSGPLSEQYVPLIAANREKRLSEETKVEIKELNAKLDRPDELDKEAAFKRCVQIIFKADGYDYFVEKSPSLDCQLELNKKVWDEARQFRQAGGFETLAKTIICPVVVIHGEYDPRPFEGVKGPLSLAANNARFILLEKCGHYPWFEKHAKETFYKILTFEITCSN